MKTHIDCLWIHSFVLDGNQNPGCADTPLEGTRTNCGYSQHVWRGPWILPPPDSYLAPQVSTVKTTGGVLKCANWDDELTHRKIFPEYFCLSGCKTKPATIYRFLEIQPHTLVACHTCHGGMCSQTHDLVRARARSECDPVTELEPWGNRTFSAEPLESPCPDSPACSSTMSMRPSLLRSSCSNSWAQRFSLSCSRPGDLPAWQCTRRNCLQWCPINWCHSQSAKADREK